jgi:RNA polymerase I-specific transcription initiation factor RRN7
VCRDIWALHLSLIPKPPPAEPHFYAQGARDREENDEEAGSQDDADDREEAENVSSSSSDETEPQADNVDPELAALLRLNSESESSSDSDTTPDTGTKAHIAGKAKERRRRGVYLYDGPASTVAVLVVACWTMRLPILYMDFIKWVFFGHVADGVQWN